MELENDDKVFGYLEQLNFLVLNLNVQQNKGELEGVEGVL